MLNSWRGTFYPLHARIRSSSTLGGILLSLSACPWCHPKTHLGVVIFPYAGPGRARESLAAISAPAARGLREIACARTDGKHGMDLPSQYTYYLGMHSRLTQVDRQRDNFRSGETHCGPWLSTDK